MSAFSIPYRRCERRWQLPHRVHAFGSDGRRQRVQVAAPRRELCVDGATSRFDNAWIVFPLAPEPLPTRAGKVYAIALMEPASRDVLGIWFVRDGRRCTDEAAAKRPFEHALRESHPWPTRLLVTSDCAEQLVAMVASRMGMAIERVDPEQLRGFTADVEHAWQRGLADLVVPHRREPR